MKQDETDPTGDLDAGWDEGDEPVESGRTGALSGSGRAALVKPISVAPPADETDEFDAAWVAPDPAAPRGAAPEEEDLDGGWEAVGAAAGAGAGAGQPVDQGPRGAARVSFKKAHRQLRLKNQEQALRSKKTRKAERKAKRREEARQSRQRREEEARLARELKARRDQEKRTRAKQHATPKVATPKVATPKKAAERARPASVEAPRSESSKRQQQALGNVFDVSKKKRKQARRQRRARARLAVIVLVGLVVVALVAWRLAVS